MSDTTAQRAILELAAARGEVVLAGNKEYYSYLQRQANGLWLRVDGDTMTRQEEVTQLQDADVLQAIFWRARDMLGHYGPDDGSVTWQDVLAWLHGSRV
ncbi:MAG: hypothetical protein KF887_07650 [Paracoccaceae bacterium]|nr:MAG: hypothetical protein KF887_07650 [Paracoccaceae bacterium]